MRGAKHVITRRQFLSGGKRLNIHRVPRQGAVGQHRHEFYEIVVALSGSGTHVTGAYRHQLAAGDLLVLNPRRAHGYENCRGLNIINILIRDDLLSRIGRSLGDLPGYGPLFRVESERWRQREYAGHLSLTQLELKRVEEWAQRIEEEMRLSTRASALLQEACLAFIIDIACRSYERRHAPDRHRVDRGASDRLGRLLSWIERNLDSPLKVPLLAAEAGMSTRAFYRVFQRVTHMTPQAYLSRSRINRAIDMLTETGYNRTITEVALACGYSDSNYFANCFRRATGLSPTDYRRKAMGQLP